MARWPGLGTTTGSHKNMFLAGYPRTNGLSVANDYGNILDGDKPTCLTLPARAHVPRRPVRFVYNMP